MIYIISAFLIVRICRSGVNVFNFTCKRNSIAAPIYLFIYTNIYNDTLFIGTIEILKIPEISGQKLTLFITV